MRAIEKIRNYLATEKERGRLRPGDRLPSYHELMDKLGGSCATIHLAMKKLAAEGLVEIKNGLGAYLAGSAPLKIKLVIGANHMDLAAMQEMIMRRVAARDLYLEVEVVDREVLHASEIQDYKHLGGDEKVYVISSNPGQNFSVSGLANLQVFEGFEAMAAELLDIPGVDKTVSLPFFQFNYQIGMNLRLLAQAGIDPASVGGEDLRWHEDVFKRCRAKGLTPASCRWSAFGSWWISILDLILCPLLLKEKNILPPYNHSSVYDTRSGREAFKILAGHDFYQDLGDKQKVFMHGGAAVSFSEGSWFAVQGEARSTEPLENFKFVPYSVNGKKINFLGVSCLQTYLAANLTPDERNRVMELLKILVSKDFQTEYCGRIGGLSVRKDMTAADYAWNTRADFAAFVPGENEIDIWTNEQASVFLAAKAAYFELYKFHGADLDLMLKCLDDKTIPR